ncbi:glycosyltransferase family 4 protein [Patescibacteria group bacterium]|nr:glycosyltransferase family 4 protein [Patescibacteria group bacterium]
MKEKLLFVLPEYKSDSSSHFVHTIELLEEVGKEIDLYVFIEHAEGKPVIKNAEKVYTSKTNLPILGLLNRILIFVWYRLRGGKNFYVHYSYFSCIICSLISRLTFAKTYYWHCEEYINYGSDRRSNIIGYLKWKIFDDLLLRLSLKLCNHLVTGSAELIEKYHKTFGVNKSKIKIVPNSINLERFKIIPKAEARKKLNLPPALAKEIKPNQKIALFVHWLAPRKGADLLPQIIENVTKKLHQQKNQDTVFLIVGDGPLYKELKQKKYPCPVIFTGKVPNKEVSNYFMASDLFIMPSRQEGFPRVLLEAMASGIPIVTFDAGGIPGILTEEQREFMVEKNDIEEFIKKTAHLLTSDNKRANLIKQGKSRVNEFGHERVAKQFLAII